jgi:aryl-alcohol dehydrogenase-like predicted oxidoreductase
LRNLGLGTIDLQQLHVWTAEWAEREEWRRAAEDLKRSGKIRAFGISLNSHAPDSALEVIESGLIDCVQVVYNIFEQAPEQNLFPLAIQRNVGIIARVPLEEGALAGTIDENTKFDPQDFRAEFFSGDRKKQMIERVAALKRDLEAAGVSEPLPEVALRFSISHPAVSTVIPGMRRVRHALSNCAVSERGPLDAKTLALLRRHAWLRSAF